MIRKSIETMVGLSSEPKAPVSNSQTWHQRLPVDIVDTMNFDTYSEFLQVPRMLDVQLKAKTATAAELEAHPARLSKEDGRRHFRWIRAQQDFFQNSRQSHQPLGGLEVLQVDAECSQAVLDEIVKAVYRRHISIDYKNAGAILAAGDYLQAGWLTEVVCQWVKDHWLRRDPVAVLALGQKVSGHGIKEDAVLWICAAWQEKQMDQLFVLTANDSLKEQAEILDIMVRIANLSQILEALGKNEERGGWGLCGPHVLQLSEAFPQHCEILDCLLDEDDPRPSLKRNRQRLKLAQIGLSTMTQMEGMTWRILLPWLRHQEGEDSVLISPDSMRVSEGRRFHMQVKMKQGAWGVLLKPMGAATWQRGDAFRVVPEGRKNVTSEPHCDLRWDDGNDGKSISWGYGDMLSRWLKAPLNDDAKTNPDIMVLRLIKIPSR